MLDIKISFSCLRRCFHMKRKLYDSLMQWKTEENGRTALLMENIVAQMLAASGR